MNKIIPNPFPDEYSGDIGIEKMTITYVQSADTESDRDDDQYLEIEAVSVPVGDDDTLPYFYRIKTDKWAVDNPEELSDLLKDFINRLKITTENNEKL